MAFQIKKTLVGDTAQDRQLYIAAMNRYASQPVDWAGTPMQWAKTAESMWVRSMMVAAAEAAIDVATVRAGAEARVDTSVVE